MEALIKRRGAVKGSITKIATAIDELTKQTPPPDAAEINIRMTSIETSAAKFDTVQDQIEEACSKEELDAHLDERQAVEEKIILIKSKLQRLLPPPPPGPSVPANPNNAAVQQTIVQVHQPPHVPTFDGKYSEWATFNDLYTAGVHLKSSYTAAQKLQYLKGYLKGEPARLLQSFQVTDGNYEEALQVLKKRYENKRLTVYSHAKALLQAPACTSDSFVNLRKLLNAVTENLGALKVLGAPIDQWDFILVPLVCERLDTESRRQWELAQKDTEPPKYKDLVDFLEIRCKALEAAPSTSSSKSSNSNPSSSSKPNRSNTVTSFTSHEASCVVCGENHALYHCAKFKGSSYNEKVNIIKSNKLCFNCLLRTKHIAAECEYGNCRKCSLKHHTLLHRTTQPSTTAESTSVENNSSNQSGQVVQNLFTKNSQFQVLLSTAEVIVEDGRQQLYKARTLIDAGSQANFITDAAAKKLGLSRKQYHVTIQGIGNNSNVQSKGLVSLKLASTKNSFQMNIDAVVLPKICGDLPSAPVDSSKWQHIRHLDLADPNFNVPNKIDILLGAEVFSQILLNNKIDVENGPPAFDTKLGWILSGSCKSEEVVTPVISSLLAVDTDQFVRKFWEIEEVPTKPILSPEEQACEDNFVATHRREPDGRYTVDLPIRNNQLATIGESRTKAVNQFKGIERQLAQNQERKAQYIDFMTEYQLLGHMEAIPSNEIFESSLHYYIPHHAVIRNDSSTTKLRVVFNASSKSSTGTSLNDQLMVGPTVQSDLASIVLRFRNHQVALIADAEKMYRQIWVNPMQQDLQRIVWRSSPNEPIRDYRLKTVTYGTASAPYLATRTLVQLSEDEENRFPLGAVVLKNDFYVDDLISGADSEEEAIDLHRQLDGLLKSGGFNLRKWASSSSTVLQAITIGDQHDDKPFQFTKSETIKTLGIQWEPSTDQFSFSIDPRPVTTPTKRSVLSEVSRLFDPLGWLSPTVIVGKMLIQKLWVCGIDWDSPLPPNLEEEWQKFNTDLVNVNQLRIPRYTAVHPESLVELHGFSDASENAYGAVVYLRVIQASGEVVVSLLCSKTRVSPVKQISIPRLELCGAQLLAKLLHWTAQRISSLNPKLFAWTDSTIVLCWLSDFPRRWKTFVANRVSEIQQVTSVDQWHHVSSQDNPADLCSRGLLPSELIGNQLWWFGPSWLMDKNFSIPSAVERSPELQVQAEVERRKEAVTQSFVTQVDTSVIDRFSSLSRLIRSVAYCFRFVKNCRDKANRQTGFLSVEELNFALTRCILLAQQEAFSVERSTLEGKQELSPKSALQSLHPFLDESGILRVGGRLQNANVPYDQKHPTILPNQSTLTKLIIRYEHLKHMHADCTLLLSVLQRQYWILRARSTVRHVIFQCITCYHQKAKVAGQLMGSLPQARVEQTRPFLSCGVDYAGPIAVKSKTGRGRHVITKGYVVIFVCFAVKAIHIELASDLSTECFLAAFRRFVARRGKPANVYSDCGTNFVGANKELETIFKAIAEKSAIDQIQWHFNPPSAPHFGGLWEAGVKSMKYHLRRVIGQIVLTYEELLTVLTQIESCLNSRPLSALPNTINEWSVLTPGHFLIGEPLTAVPDQDLTNVPSNRLNRWKLLQQMQQHFWTRWSSEYLSRLQQRPKWTVTNSNLSVGDLVLVKDDQTKSMNWPLARIEEVHPGKDNLVRVVTVRMNSGLFKRPIAKVCKLPCN